MFATSLRTAAAHRLTVLRAPTAVRGITTTVPLCTENDPTKPNSFGHATRKAGETLEGGLDVQSASVQAGFDQAKHGKKTQAEPYDTAAEDAGGQKAPSVQKEDALKDAKTGAQAAFSAGSFKDHRAGAQSSGEYAGEVGGKEEAAAPSFKASVKQVLGMDVNKQEHQESKTGPGVRKQQMHTSARRSAPGGTEGKAYSGSKSTGDTMSEARKPKDTNVQGDQNPHLKHKQPEQAEGGAGNAGTTPHLPSKSRAGQAADDLRTDPSSVRKAQFHTSARRGKDAAAGYVAATENPAKAAGYDTPAEALPSADLYGNKLPPAGDLKPSSALPHSTTAQAPRHPVMGDQARDGTLADRNPPPLTSEAG
ncbi:hypothetical protein QFC19_001120 [Naganishia cerealis]|uniref:Uncharacterized protein n=1 Tax=Naganishia cerealis TaxID=610337 RepID=A0ACC2WI77_9TREE|nr:hypothetical protein QFC19_001120 [Naganishia cerealis]